MTNIEALLTNLYRLRATVQQLLSNDSSAIFNLPVRPGSRAEKEKTLATALANGIVRLRRHNTEGLGRKESRRLVTSMPLDLSQASLEVELTTRGGSLWEKRASPMWEYFVDEGESRAVRGYVWIVLEARNRSWLNCVDHTLRRSGFFVSNERRITTKRGWKPVYWKQFKLGYSLAINTGHRVETELGKRFLQGIAAADEQLADRFSVLAGIWDAKWVASLQ